MNKFFKIIIGLIIIATLMNSISICNPLINDNLKIASTSEALDINATIVKVYNDLSVTKNERITNEISQNVFHKKATDSYSDGDACTPIARVKVEPDDIKRAGKLSLTFDCAYSVKNLPLILEILDIYGIKASFFATMEFISAYPELVIEIIKRGHDFGNHSTTHPNFNSLSDEEVVREVMICHKYVKETFGIDMCLFRYPYGESNERNMQYVTALGYYPINWSFDSLDWKNEVADKICKRLVKHQFVNGQILLFHVSGEHTPEALPPIIEYLRACGFDFIKLSDMIYHEDFVSYWGTQSKKAQDFIDKNH